MEQLKPGAMGHGRVSSVLCEIFCKQRLADYTMMRVREDLDVTNKLIKHYFTHQPGNKNICV